MKKKQNITISLLILLILLTIMAVVLLSYKPKSPFIPQASENTGQTDWNKEESIPKPSITSEAETLSQSKNLQQTETGTADDTTQQVQYEDEKQTQTSLSSPIPKDQPAKPTAPPVTDSDLTDPDTIPVYENESLPSSGNNSQSSPDPKPVQQSPSSPGTVYDPVFGEIPAASVQQQVVDSDGDINKQVGSMGN